MAFKKSQYRKRYASKGFKSAKSRAFFNKSAKKKGKLFGLGSRVKTKTVRRMVNAAITSKAELKKAYEPINTVALSFTSPPTTIPTASGVTEPVIAGMNQPITGISGRWLNFSNTMIDNIYNIGTTAMWPINYQNNAQLIPQVFQIQGIYPAVGPVTSASRIGRKVSLHRVVFKLAFKKVVQYAGYPSAAPTGAAANEFIDEYCNQMHVLMLAPTYGNAGALNQNFYSNVNALAGDANFWEMSRLGTAPFGYMTDNYKVKILKSKKLSFPQPSFSIGADCSAGIGFDPMAMWTQNSSGTLRKCTMSMRFSKGHNLHWETDLSGAPENLPCMVICVWYGCSGLTCSFQRYVSFKDL